jgi:hypothetical protein
MNNTKLFEDLFRQPQEGDEVLLLSPTEILERICNQKKTNVVTQSNATLLGTYLHRKGYLKGKGEKRRCYLVALKY